MKTPRTSWKAQKKHTAPLALAAALSIPLLAAAPATAEVNSDTIDKSIVWVDTAWSATVQVPFKDGTTETYKTTLVTLCTGWFVSTTGHVATAGHCVDADDALYTSIYAKVIDEQGLTGVKPENVDWPLSLADPLIKVDQPSGIDGGLLSGKTAITAQLIAKQGFEKGDNALLRIADMKDTPALALGAEAPKVREKVTSVGFPDLVGSTSDVERQKPSYRSGAVSSRSYSTQGVPRTEIDTDITPGMSGGPSVNEDGEVIGINSAYVARGSGQANYITDTQTLRDFLTSNGVKLAEATTASATPAAAADAPTSTTQDAPGIPLWLTAIVAVLVLAVVGMAVLLIMNMRKQRQPAAYAQAPAGPPAAIPPTPWMQNPNHPDNGPGRAP
ncbi:trypsin-like peptidase domain-containing protein [Paenarthrobacter sp. PAE-2]|uniref:trypsin-like peptidase domain-containing protein n=1 Tax=Paenarthrobacter sp. PAE-2 TaxID=2982532 RepID=UPI00223237A4|nr:trypsin-like peptidase domain-containing protein [Paenarthrobacter sp. PAE-2]MCW3766044.1 trypsin-like peptidase domain-containing protein [Paenarthrobacter sp. PAE-2]